MKYNIESILYNDVHQKKYVLNRKLMPFTTLFTMIKININIG